MSELYISVDVETDGPIPGPYSMNSLGASAVSYRTNSGELVRVDHSLKENQFYCEIKPISEKWVPEAFNIAKFPNFNGDTLESKRDYIEAAGTTPEEAMKAFQLWIESVKQRFGITRVVFAAYPLGFDWMWTYWYLIQYTGTSPFGHSSHIDIKTLYSKTANVPIGKSVKSRMPKVLHSKLKHDHNPVTDSREQGDLFNNIFEWNENWTSKGLH